MPSFLTPQPLSGFPEHLPEIRLIEQQLLDTIRHNYELAGFVNIETPAVERTEILTSKGADDKEIYTVGRLHATSHDKTDKIALHFDLTVPTARYVVQHAHKLTFPFRRYQIQKVWRGERAQGGRYREFYQADIDIIGDGELSTIADVDIVATISRILTDLKIGNFSIHLNNRKIIVGFVQSLAKTPDAVSEILKIIDKIPKITEEQAKNNLQEFLLPQEITQVLHFCALSSKGNQAVLDFLQQYDQNEVQEGYKELSYMYSRAIASGIRSENITLNPAIVRGLGYYTGTIYETFLEGHESIGSICSGGRYDNLASYFTDKKYPGVGVSIGVSRLLYALLQQLPTPTTQTPSKVLISCMHTDFESQYFEMLANIRANNIPAEMYLDTTTKLAKQLKYANKKHIPFVVIAGEDEFSQKTVQVKHMLSGTSETIPQSQLIDKLKSIV